MPRPSHGFNRSHSPRHIDTIRPAAPLTGLTEDVPDRLTQLAAVLLNAPCVLLSVGDADRQVVESTFGFLQSPSAGHEAEIANSLCRQVVARGSPLVVDDVRGDTRFNSPAMGVGAFLGIPLKVSEGAVFGAFCVLDTQPRVWRARDAELLSDLASILVREIELRQTLFGQQAALEAHAFHVRVVASVHDAVIATGPDYRIRVWNSAAEALFGWSADEVEGLPINEIIPVQRYLSGSTDEEALTVLHGTGAWKGDVVQHHRDGNEVVVAAAVRRMTDEEGQPTGVVTISRDLSDGATGVVGTYRSAAMQEREEPFRRIFEESPVGMAMAGLDYHLINVNPRFCEMIGYTKEKLLSRTCPRLTHPEDIEREAPLRRQLGAGTIVRYNIEKRYVTKGRRIIWAHVTCTLMRPVNGDSPYITAVVEEITERKRAEQQLHQSEESLRFVLESSRLGYWDMDIVANTTRRSLRHDQCFGYSELLPHWGYDTFLAHVHPDDRERVNDSYQRARAGIGDYNVEFRAVWPDQSVHWLLSIGRFTLDEHGVAVRVSGVQLDVTERKVHEQALTGLSDQIELQSRIFNTALSSISDFAYILDHEVRFVYANQSLLTLWGLLLEDIVGKSFEELNYPDELARRLRRQVLQVFDTKLRVADEASVPMIDGYRYYEYILHPVFGVGGSVDLVVGSTRDITARKEAALAEQEAQRFLQSTLDALSAHVAVLDQDGIIIAVNKAWRDFAAQHGNTTMSCGVGDDYIEACANTASAWATDAPLISGGIRNVLNGQCPEFSLEYDSHDQTGKRWFLLRVTRFTGGGPLRLVVSHENISELKLAEEQLIYDAFHDALTGMPNRALFLDHLHQALERRVRTPDRACAVLFLDLDRFKAVNDSLGHTAGDDLLIAVGRRLEQCVRPADTVSRLGGDEFAILLEDLVTIGNPIDVAERITAAFQRPFIVHGRDVYSSLSIGIAISGQGTVHGEDLLRDADIAMYRAKQSGRPHVVADPGMHAAILARLQLEEDLRLAITRGEFLLHYQPAMAIDGRRLVGVEALVRWQHPTRGLIAPSEFIALAEETGLIVPLGMWVLHTACVQLNRWLEAGLPPFFVGINLSARQFKQPDLASKIRDVLLATGLDPQYLCLELTESMLMEDAAATVLTLQELRGVGICALAIDDFGTGYSSLSYLQRFPVTEIKIDRSFVRDVTTNSSNAAIATATIVLAHSLGLQAVAEGVETEEQRAFLEHAGCDRFQGYLVSRPVAAEELSALVRGMLPSHL
ncbi:MAG: hypothetical protein NVS4B8_07720 [Herpetosiphon sp.]